MDEKIVLNGTPVNLGRRKNNKSSQYYGVTRIKSGKWNAQVKGEYLGTFELESSAGSAVNDAIREYGYDIPLNVIVPDDALKVIGSDDEWQEQEDDGTPSVYFALAPSINRMKVGWTGGHPVKRVAAINSGSPVDVILLGAIRGRGEELEKRLHRKFARYHLKGEWFTASEIVQQVIALPGFCASTLTVRELMVLGREELESNAHWVPEAWKEV